MVDKLVEQLILHEGLRLKPYTDTVGKVTIGVGRNLTDNGISRDEAIELLQHDIMEMEAELHIALPWTAGLDSIRQRVLLDMAFNMGVPKLLGFTRTLARVAAGDYSGAAGSMLDSKWAKQVGQRARRLAKMMATGEDYP